MNDALNGSGGGGGRYSFVGYSGGGSYFLAGADLLVDASGENSGNGLVTLDELQSYGAPEPASLALMGAGLAGISFVRRRRKHR